MQGGNAATPTMAAQPRSAEETHVASLHGALCAAIHVAVLLGAEPLLTGGGRSHPEAGVAVISEAAQLVHERGGDLGAPAVAEGRAAVRLEKCQQPLVLLQMNRQVPGTSATADRVMFRAILQAKLTTVVSKEDAIPKGQRSSSSR